MVAGLALLALPGSAQNYLYWDLNGLTAGAGGGTTPSGIWNTTDARWNALNTGSGPVVPWLNNSVAVFSAGTNATGAYTITLAANSLPVGGVTFQDGAVTLGGTGSLLLVNPTTGSTPYLSLGGTPATLGSGVTLTGFTGLNIIGTGTLTLQGQSTVLGPTLIDGVTVQLGASDRLGDASPVLLTNGGTLALAGFDEWVGGLSGTGSVTLGGGTLTVDTANSTTFSGTISGAGGVWKLGDGTLTLTNPVGWTGETWIGKGTLALGAANLFPDTAAVSLAPEGTFFLGAYDDRVGSIDGDGSVVLAGGALQLGTAASFTCSAQLAGFGDVRKMGTGTMTLSRASSLVGNFKIEEGAVQLGVDECLLDTSDLSVWSGTTFDLHGHTETVGELFGSGTIKLGGGTLAVQAKADGVADGIDADIVGPGTWLLLGPGSVNFRGTFGSTGTLLLQAGTLFVGRNNSFGSGVTASVAPGARLDLRDFNMTIGPLSSAGTIDLGTGRLTLAGDGDSVLAGPVEGFGGITKTGSGTLTLSGAATNTGQTRVLQGTMRLTRNDRLPFGAAVEIAAGATLELNRGNGPSGTVQDLGAVTGAGDVTLTDAANCIIALGADGSSFTFDGRLRGIARYRKEGAGTMILAGASDFTGEFAVAAGTVRLAGDERLPLIANGRFTVATNATLELAGHVQHLVRPDGDGMLDLGAGGHAIFTETGNWYGAITGSGQLTKEGSGSVGLYGPLTYVGPTWIHAGQLAIYEDNNTDTDIQVDAGATLKIGNYDVTFDQLTGAGTVDGTAGLTHVGRNNGDFAFDGTITGQTAGRFGKVGTGRFTLNGTSSIGTVLVEAGTFALGGNERLADATNVQLAAGATFDLGGRTETLDALTGTGAVALGGGTLQVGASGATFAFGGTLQNDGTFVKLGAGACTLNPAQNFAGTLRVSAGSLNLTNLGSSPFGTAEIASAGTLVLPAGTTLGGTVQNDGAVDFGSGAPVILSGALSGAGRFKGPAVFTGSFSPGNAGNAFAVGEFSGALTLAASHTLRLELGGVSPGSSHDQIHNATTVTLGGKLEVTLRNGFVPTAGQSFTLFAAPTVGAFNQLALPPLTHGLAWDTSTLATDGTLRVLGGYAAFVAQYGLDPLTSGAPLANPSGDGVSNLLKFLLGGNPLVAQSGLLPAATTEAQASGTVLVLAYDRDILAAASLGNVGADSSTDLANWTPALAGISGVTVDVTPIDSVFEHVVVRIPVASTRGFARVRATL